MTLNQVIRLLQQVQEDHGQMDDLQTNVRDVRVFVQYSPDDSPETQVEVVVAP